MARTSGQVEGSAEFLSANIGNIIIKTGGDGFIERSADRVFANDARSVSGCALKRHIHLGIGFIG